MTQTNAHIPIQWTTEGFMQRYDEYLHACKTYHEAYKLTEEEHTKTCGRSRYKSYDAFRQVRKSQILKK